MHLKFEDGNEHNKYAVTVMIGGRTGEYVPKNWSKILNLFLLSLIAPSHVKSPENVLIEKLDTD